MDDCDDVNVNANVNVDVNVNVDDEPWFCIYLHTIQPTIFRMANEPWYGIWNRTGDMDRKNNDEEAAGNSKTH